MNHFDSRILMNEPIVRHSNFVDKSPRFRICCTSGKKENQDAEHDKIFKSLSENSLWRETRFGRSAPVLGRSNVTLRISQEKSRAIACCVLLWPRTTTLRKQAFQTSSKHFLTSGCSFKPSPARRIPCDTRASRVCSLLRCS